MRIEGDSIVVATTSQISCVLDKDTVILHFDKGYYFGLNELGSLIWNQVQQPRRVREICESILREYDVDACQCERDVMELLGKLQTEGLVRVVDPAASLQ
jgi:hypothetical protein